MATETGKANTSDLMEREREVKGAFSPSAPVTRKDLFAGRAHELIAIVEATEEPGQHVVLYGERGVGKTSLAAVSRDIFGAAVTIRVNCLSGDTFEAVWRRCFGEFTLRAAVPGFGFTRADSERIVAVGDYFRDIAELTPDHVRIGLEMVSSAQPVTVFIDEFDRIEDERTHSLFADTIKALSDQLVPATVVIVGVADDVDELVSEHLSIERAIVQIYMPRMSQDELAQIVQNGFDSVAIDYDDDAVERITTLSQGLPHYTHLLAQHAGASAVWDRSEHVSLRHVEAAVSTALAKAQESLHDDYYRATQSNRENMYKQVLLACACARVDERGFFAAAGLREPLSVILGRKVDIPAFAAHLNALSSDRGPVLKKEGTAKKFRYRFLKPIMQPYVIMRGLADQMIDADTVGKLQIPRA